MIVEPEAIVSLHDVMPETFPRIEELLAICRSRGIPPVTLLVVPGRNWKPAQLERLRELVSEGHQLAAHGWFHHVTRRGSLYHRLHAAILSKDVAEHLALDSLGIRDLMVRSCHWFEQQSLPNPDLYVPPAWALGPISREDLKAVPVRQIEILRGLLHPESGRMHRLPMIGFEAASAWRAGALRTWNAAQLMWASIGHLPVRIALHPHDFHLRLARPLTDLLALPWRFTGYGDLSQRLGATPHRST